VSKLNHGSKSLLIACTAAALMSTVAACGSDDSDASPTAEEVPTMTTKKADPVEGKNKDTVCVRNAGGKQGLAVEVTDKLEAAKIKVTDFRNLHTSAIVETSVLYAPNQKELAEKAAKASGQKAQVVERPRSFDPCDGAVVMVLI